MEYARKHKTVKAMQLTKNNLQEVIIWSRGKLKAFATNRPEGQPPIEVQSITNPDMRRYAQFNWWVLLLEDGSLDIEVDGQFEEEYEVVH